MLSIEERLRRFSPCACRLLARKVSATGRVVALTDEEIAAGAGLTVPQVARLGRLASWHDQTVSIMLGYTHGCGVDLDSRENIKSHMAIQRKVQRGGNIPRYLRESPLWETTFKPILVRASKG